MVHVDSYTSRGQGATSVVNRKAMACARRALRGDRTRYRLKHVHDVYTYLVIRHTRNSRRHFMHKKSTRKTKNNELCIDEFRVPSSENLFAGESLILPGQQEMSWTATKGGHSGMVSKDQNEKRGKSDNFAR